MKLGVIDPGEIREGLDRQNLTQIRRRFVTINNDRLQRLHGALSERQQLILDAIPLLFHTNHPMMPGYVCRDTPSRLCRFSLNKDNISLGRTIARSFTPNVDINRPEEIFAIYVMGSVGTIAQSEKSDLDIWLCFKPGLERKAIENLNKKCLKISEWAMSVRLEVHFFLMNNEAFKQGQVSALNEESSGSAQRLLLLDEFYRTAIHIGGRKPLWWFVPADQEHRYPEYTHTLLHKRFINQESVLDFGGIATIPDGEFVGAGIWQLYKAIESPYKSVLKLLLLEAYVDGHPQIHPLSLHFKEAVYNGKLDIDDLDSYVMIYRHIEQYLLRNNQTKRLELARRCFYFKVNKPLSKPPRNREKSWQRRLLERLTNEWGWSPQYIAMLDGRKKWKALQVADERSLLVSELNHSYRFIQEFAAETGAVRAISTEELTILGRKLQAAFERKPGKIEWINPGISSDLSEAALSFTEAYDRNTRINVWTAIAREAGTTLNGEGTPIKSASSLIELIVWLYFNGVLDTATYIDLQGTPSIKDFNLRKILSRLQQWLPLPLPPLSHESFKRSSAPTKVLMLLNVGKSATPQLEERGMQRLSNQGDALRYSGFEENLVASVDMITRNTWNEINSRRFDNTSALLDALQEYLQLCLPGTHQTPPELTVECIGSTHAGIISKRVERWFNDIISCYYGGRYPAATRYLFEMAGDFFSLQFRGARLITQQHRDEKALFQYLGDEQLAISPIMIDSRALSGHALRTITDTISNDTGGRAWSGAIHVFYQRFDIGMEVTVVDEWGSLIHRTYLGNPAYSPLKPLHRFLRAVVDRQTRMNHQLLYDFGIFPMHFFELVKRGQLYSAQQKQISRELPAASEFQVRAIAHPGAGDTIVYDFYCDDQEFLANTFADHLYIVVAQHILKLRSSRQHYPVYLSDIDLSLCQQQLSDTGRLGTCHYLREKDKLEFRLNEAIGILLKP